MLALRVALQSRATQSCSLVHRVQVCSSSFSRKRPTSVPSYESPPNRTDARVVMHSSIANTPLHCLLSQYLLWFAARPTIMIYIMVASVEYPRNGIHYVGKEEIKGTGTRNNHCCFHGQNMRRGLRRDACVSHRSWETQPYVWIKKDRSDGATTRRRKSPQNAR